MSWIKNQLRKLRTAEVEIKKASRDPRGWIQIFSDGDAIVKKIPEFKTIGQLAKEAFEQQPAIHLEDSGDAIDFYRDGRLIYDIILDQCHTRAETLDWIRQISEKTWASKETISQLCTLLMGAGNAQ
jgi:hypothetical protein